MLVRTTHYGIYLNGTNCDRVLDLSEGPVRLQCNFHSTVRLAFLTLVTHMNPIEKSHVSLFALHNKRIEIYVCTDPFRTDKWHNKNSPVCGRKAHTVNQGVLTSFHQCYTVSATYEYISLRQSKLQSQF
jgi:hypothetical protein